MITAPEIAALIKAPEQTAKTQLDELSLLAEKYPYSQLFSLIYLQGLGKHNDLRFDEELLKHSFRITDRARLYRLIHDQHISTPRINEEITSVNFDEDLRHPIEEQDLTVIESIEEVSPKIEKITSEPNVDEVRNDQSAFSENSERTVEPETIDPFAQIIDETPTEKLESDPLDKLILQHAVSNSYHLEELTQEEIEKMERRKEESEVEAVREEQLPPSIEIETKHSFTSWLTSNRNAFPENKEEQNAVRAVVRDFQSFDPSEELFGEVEKPKKDFFSPARKAKESLREDDLPVSETLAKIYAIQGNFPKAIRAYQQLSLIYPEKKTFFATLIADLEQKLNLK